MKTRLVVFTRVGAQEGPVLFAVPLSGALETDVGGASLTVVAAAGQFTRHEAFDWAAGDAGAKCALLESETMPSALVLGSATWTDVRWLSFPLAAKALTNGTDRRYLQLAVQYVSSGGVVEDNLIAANADADLLGTLGKALEDKAVDMKP